MSTAFLEHVNVTVSDPAATAKRLEDWFGWKIRWQGPSLGGGTTCHIGNESSYVAAYSPPDATGRAAGDSYSQRGGLNHIAVVVEDLDETEKRIKSGGYETHSHADYEPGRRFYFHDDDGIEFEVVSYRT
ncbi:VOC family protein [Labrenzia sp. 011]|uniref:VOC family protein n=1 Tax=Labrenzia sp. 011 TaxID=2171494 RepID=UPI000D5239CE|nr:VOC family protein [Labrenzia sp. 011]PVB60752.1 glyoxalase [Labrenzia sp. 011]